jgi:hypothetical protein
VLWSHASILHRAIRSVAPSLPWIGGVAPCYPAFPQLTRHRESRSYGATSGEEGLCLAGLDPATYGLEVDPRPSRRLAGCRPRWSGWLGRPAVVLLSRRVPHSGMTNGMTGAPLTTRQAGLPSGAAGRA